MPTKQLRILSLQRQIARIQRRRLVLQRISDRYAWGRLAVFLIGAVSSGVALVSGGATWFWIIAGITAILFTSVVHYHHQVQHSIARLKVWSSLKETYVARIELDWPHIPQRFARWHAANVQPDHPFGEDLSLTGDRSVAHLIDTAQSRGGSQHLHDWLLARQPDYAQTQERQALVRELAPMPHFRDRLHLSAALANADARADWDGMRLEQWLDRLPPAWQGSLLPRLRLLIGLAAVNIVLFALNALGLIPAVWQLTALVYLAVLMFTLRSSGDLFEDATALADELERLRAVSAFIETYPLGNRSHL